MVTLVVLVVILLTLGLGAGPLSLFDFDLTTFPGGSAGLMVLIVVALLVTRKI